MSVETSAPNRPAVRFEAVLDAGEKTMRAIFEGDLDWLPSSEKAVRVLLTPDDAVKLLDRGIEVRLVRAYPVGALNPALVMDDEAALAWLEEATRGMKRGRAE